MKRSPNKVMEKQKDFPYIYIRNNAHKEIIYYIQREMILLNLIKTDAG